MIAIDYKKFKDTVDEIISTNPVVLAIKQDVEVLKVDVEILKGDVQILKESVFHQGIVQEEMRHNLKLILDAVIPAQKRSERLASVEDKVDNHEVRLAAVELSVKAQRGGATK